MSEQYVGEIRCFGFNFAPVGWAQCNGQLMAISQNTALFAILGTTFGGDGVQTFALPNLQGSVPMHWGSQAGLNNQLGEPQGSPSVTLLTSQLPAHIHVINTADVPTGGNPERVAGPSATAWMSASSPDQVYNVGATPSAPLSPKAIGLSGNSLPHDNMQPYLVVNICIATVGVFPSRN
jgi:microcystin-dependent protein